MHLRIDVLNAKYSDTCLLIRFLGSTSAIPKQSCTCFFGDFSLPMSLASRRWIGFSRCVGEDLPAVEILVNINAVGPFRAWSDQHRIIAAHLLVLFGITATHSDLFVFGAWYQLGGKGLFDASVLHTRRQAHANACAVLSFP